MIFLFFSECVLALSSSVIVVFVVLVSLSFVNGFGELTLIVEYVE